MPKTNNSATRHHPGRYQNMKLWKRCTNAELWKIDKNEMIRWLRRCKLDILYEKTEMIPLPFTFNYKRHRNGTIEERKSRASLRGDQMRPTVCYDLAHTSKLMAGRIATGMVISHNVEMWWILEHLDTNSAFIHKPVCVIEMERTYTRIEPLRQTIRDVFLLRRWAAPDPTAESTRAQWSQFIPFKTTNAQWNGDMAVVVDVFLSTASNAKAMNELYDNMAENTKSKGLDDPCDIWVGTSIAGKTEA